MLIPSALLLVPTLALALPTLNSLDTTSSLQQVERNSSDNSTRFSFRDRIVPDQFSNVTFPSGPQVPPFNQSNAQPSTNESKNALSAPFTPDGGNIEQNPQSLQNEWLELALFDQIATSFSRRVFIQAGLTEADHDLIEYMAQQEVGHAVALTNMIGPDQAAKACTFQWPNFTDVQEALLFSQFVTRWGESGVLGFLPHLDSRPNAQILLQAITTESRQEMITRQLLGLSPMPVWFESGVPQAFQIFPDLFVVNQRFVPGGKPAVSTNRVLTSAGRNILVAWEEPGRSTGPNSSYTTNSTAGVPRFAAFVQQLNVTYVGLDNVNLTSRTASIRQPGNRIYGPNSAPIVNETTFLVLTDSNPFLTPYHLSLINRAVVAGPAMYIAG
ncbi:hypothetical protein OIO90_001853 [Microbotryomycetes sp. JL221]|nr:hypothetical protein OIO90_001853 [Microbotryomycetes sp. JL221]